MLSIGFLRKTVNVVGIFKKKMLRETKKNIGNIMILFNWIVGAKIIKPREIQIALLPIYVTKIKTVFISNSLRDCIYYK